jgi:outer membrane protein TolC
MKSLFIIILVGLSSSGTSQIFTLIQAEQRAISYYPIARMKSNYREIANLNKSTISKNWIPQFNAGGQATYQSDVTKITIPNAPFVVEPLSKEQFKLNLDFSQLIYDGGVSKAQKNLASINADLEENKIEVELHRLQERVQQLYLSTLYFDELIRQLIYVKADLENGIQKMTAQLDGGVVYRSTVDVLKAELLKTEQREIELLSSRESFLGAIGILTDTVLNNTVVFEKPVVYTGSTKGLINLQSSVFSVQKEMLGKQYELTKAAKNPKAYLFAQGGYGRPGLNMLRNEFDWYGIGGIRFNWNISSFYTNKNEIRQIAISQQNIQLQEETYNRNISVQSDQYQKEIQKLKSLIEKDRGIVTIRKTIKDAAVAQLEAGVITSNDYLKEVHAEDMAIQSMKAHEIQLIQAEMQLVMLKGDNNKK